MEGKSFFPPIGLFLIFFPLNSFVAVGCCACIFVFCVVFHVCVFFGGGGLFFVTQVCLKGAEGLW